MLTCNTCTHGRTHARTHTHTHTQTQTDRQTHTHTHTHTLTHSHSHSLTHSHSLSLSLSLTHSFTHSLTHTHTHTHTHSLTHSHTLSHTLSHTHISTQNSDAIYSDRNGGLMAALISWLVVQVAVPQHHGPRRTTGMARHCAATGWGPTWKGILVANVSIQSGHLGPRGLLPYSRQHCMTECCVCWMLHAVMFTAAWLICIRLLLFTLASRSVLMGQF
jgi:hypothetical protein